MAESLALAGAGPAAARALVAGLAPRDLARKPGVGKLSLLGHLLHLRDMEERVFGPRLVRILEVDDPLLEPLVIEDHVVDEDTVPDDDDIDAVLAAWEAARERNIAVVAGTGSEQWSRRASHPQLGRATFQDVVARWARHDGDHLRQIEILAVNSRERNLP